MEKRSGARRQMEKVGRGDGLSVPGGTKAAGAPGERGDSPTKTCQTKATGTAGAAG